eukprot:1390337-Prymnesium_polylepis.1
MQSSAGGARSYAADELACRWWTLEVQAGAHGDDVRNGRGERRATCVAGTASGACSLCMWRVMRSCPQQLFSTASRPPGEGE